MKKSIIISEADNIAALTENDRVVEFFVNRGELLLGDIYVAIVENILPGIDAAFVNLGKDKMGFLHANDIPGEGALRDRLVPKQKLLVQITKEPTGHKGPRVSTAISLPGRFLVLVPEERGISISRRISESKERARLKAVVTLMKPPGVGVIIRTEAKGQNEVSLFEDFEQLWDRWQSIVSESEASIGPKLIYRDQDLLYRVIRDAYSTDVAEIIVDTPDGQKRATEFMSGWAGRTTRVVHHVGDDPLLIARGIDKDIESVLSDRAELPSGGHLNIQPTEALTVIDVNSGRFTSSRTQAETVRKTNLEAAQEIPRQLRLRNIGGMVIVDFIDMESRRDQQMVLEMFNRALEDDRAKPQVGQLSDLGLVELTRRRQGQSLRELFAEVCSHCSGTGAVPTLTLGQGEFKRVITLPNRDEENNKRAGKRQIALKGAGGGQLRAVSANNGRIQPTVDELEPLLSEEDEDVTEEIDVPVEILEQMPEELLSGFSQGQEGFSIRSKYPNTEDSEDEDEDEAGSAVPAAAFKGAEYKNPFRSPYTGEEDLDEEHDDDEDEDDEDEEGPSFLAETEEMRSAVVAEVAALVELAAELSHAEIVEDDDEEGEEDESEVVVHAEALPESNFETELDPVTGIYRLKPRERSHGETHIPELKAEASATETGETQEPAGAGEVQSCAEALSEDEAHSREKYMHEENGEQEQGTGESESLEASHSEENSSEGCSESENRPEVHQGQF